jgi:hypothetical protein
VLITAFQRLSEIGSADRGRTPRYITLVTDLVYSPGLSSPAIRVVRRLRRGAGAGWYSLFLSLEAIPSLRSVLATVRRLGEYYVLHTRGTGG